MSDPKLRILSFVLIALLSVSVMACEGETVNITLSTPSVDASSPADTATPEPSNEAAATAVSVDPTASPAGGSNQDASDPAATTTPIPVAPTPTVAPTQTPVPTPEPTSTPIPAPTVSFDADINSGAAPFEVTFTATVNGNASTYLWDFGDGETSNEPSPTHNYTTAGNHSVTVTVNGPNGSGSDTNIDFISVTPGPVVELTLLPELLSITAADSTEIEATALDEFGNTVLGGITWNAELDAGGVNDDGIFTAATVAGEFAGAISATTPGESGELRATIDVTILPGPLHEISFILADLTLETNSTKPLVYVLLDEFGNYVTEFDANWTVAPGAGSIDEVNKFSASTKTGTFEGGVILNVSQGAVRKTQSLDVTITPGPPSVITVEPAQIYVAGNGTRQFSASAVDEFGNDISDLEVSWSTTGGTINGDGEFFANGNHGSHEVSALVSGESEVTGTAQAEVLPATTFVVETTNDTVDSIPGDNICADSAGQCSLRAAVMESNIRPGADIISVPTGTYVLSRVGYGENHANLGDLDIRGDLTIHGYGSDFTTIDGNNTDRALHVVSGSTIVELTDLGIRNGSVVGDGWAGGGIYNRGSLTLTRSAVVGNSSDWQGGGIWTDGTLKIFDSEVSNNSAGQLGSAVNNAGGSVRIYRSILSENNRSAFFSVGAEYLIVDSAVKDNHNGWTFYNNGDVFRVTNSTVSGNNTGGEAAVVWNDGSFRFTNTTIVSDTGVGFLFHSDSPGRLEFLNTIVTSKTSRVCNTDNGGAFYSLGHNIAADTTCLFFDDTDQIGVNARLGPLQDNGGPTETHALLSGSPAIDAAEDASAPEADQRGELRPAGSASDIGAYEVQ